MPKVIASAMAERGVERQINLKLPGAKTEVAYHQDFAYTPHTNDDIVTALLFLDDVDEGNGALTVVPGSHKGPVLSLFDGDRFTGAVAADEEKKALAQSVPCFGKAGSVCLMHTRCATSRKGMPSRQALGMPIRAFWLSMR